VRRGRSPRWTAPLAGLGLACGAAAQDDAPQGGEAIDAPAARTGDAIFTGPDAVVNQLREDAEQAVSAFGDLLTLEGFEALKNDLYEQTGLHFGVDYTASYYAATDGLGASTAGGGMARFYGNWEAIGRGTSDTGGVIFKVEHRHGYTDVPPAGLASNLGYAGLFAPPFSDQGWRLTNLYWRQSLFEGRFVTYVGFLDATDFVDAYALASPWTGFTNFVFSTGSATIGVPNDATLGAMVGLWFTESVYGMASLTDANADPTDPFEGFNSFFNDFETFKSLEVGWTPSRDEFFLNNVHVTLWHVDERDEAAVPDGWGLNVSASVWIDDQWLPFIRAGWAEDGGSLLEASVSAGFGYQRERSGDVLGVGLNWGRPNGNTFGADLDDQYTAEIYYRWRLTQRLEVTPSVQVLANPALNPDEDVIGVFGIRARVVF
jgi:porin